MTYYNDNSEQACAWLRELIAAKLIPPGEVDCRSIRDVQPGDLRGFTQCHFFAGIGGWERALQLAGWPADRPVWTGSCPCQPFSCAGKGLGTADERHLWPEFMRLIRECRPVTVFGEQVANAVGQGWLDGISADLEAEGYACGAAVLGAHSVNAPHIRQRLYWVADAELARRQETWSGPEIDARRQPESGLAFSRLDNAAMPRHASEGQGPDLREQRSGECVPGQSGEAGAGRRESECDGGMDHAKTIGREVRQPIHREHDGQGFGQGCDSFWSSAIWHQCRDGKLRRIPVEPALFPLAARLPGRVGLLRGAGNAIVPQVAAQFVRAFIEL